MKSISIQGIDEQLSARLQQQAATARKSVNQFILDTLRKQLGLEKERKLTTEHNDLDSLFGTWTEEEFNSIQGKISSERRIDSELWQ